MAWTPDSLFGAADTGGWFDASDLATLFQDSAGTIPVTGDTQPVGLLKAKAGAGSIGFQLAQSTSAAKPTYKTSAGQSWLQFDGGDWLDSGLSRFGRAGLFAGAAEAWTVVVAVRNAANGCYVARAGSDPALKTFQLYTTGQYPSWLLRGGTVGAINVKTGAHVVGVRWTGSAASARLDNATAVPAIGTAAEEAGQRILVGARTNGAGFLLQAPDSLAQIFFIDRALSDTEYGYLFGYFAQALGLSGVGTTPPNEVTLDAVTAVAPANTALGSVIASPGLAAVPVLAPAMLAASAVASHPALGAASACALAQAEVAAVVGEPSLSDASTTASAANVTAAVQSEPGLAAASVAAPATVNAGALAGQPALGAVNACAPAGMGITGLGGEQALGSSPAEAPAMTLTAGLVSAPVLGAALSCAPAVPLAAMLATAPTLGGAETVGLVAAAPAELALFAPEPLRSARLASRDAAPRLHSRARAGLASRSATLSLTSRAA